MLGWGRRLSSENGAHPGMGQAGVTSQLHSEPSDSQTGLVVAEFRIHQERPVGFVFGVPCP
jgi:hypothetical protein